MVTLKNLLMNRIKGFTEFTQVEMAKVCLGEVKPVKIPLGQNPNGR